MLDEGERKHRRFSLSALWGKIGDNQRVESNRPSGVDAEVIGRCLAIHLKLGMLAVDVFELTLIVVEPPLLLEFRDRILQRT